MIYKAFCGPDGTSIILITTRLQTITANGFLVQANFFGNSGYSG